MATAADVSPLGRQFVALQELWTDVYRPLVVSTDDNRLKAERAVSAMYEIMGYQTPQIEWIDTLSFSSLSYTRSGPRLPALSNLGEPLTNVRNSLMFSGWGGLEAVERSAREVGYRRGRFHLPANKETILRNMEIPRRDRRPVWFRNGDNLFCRFDADALAVAALAVKEKIPISAKTSALAEAAEELLRYAFGGFFFRYGVWMFPTPAKIDLDETHTIIAEHPNPAFVFGDSNNTKVWARSGIILWQRRRGPELEEMVSLIQAEEPRRRHAVIDYFGWNRVLEACRQIGHGLAQRIAEDGYGILWRVTFRNAHRFLVVQVTNSTRLPNGHFERFVIPVDAQCRPLPDPNNPRATFGKPQLLTPLNAVARYIW